MTRARSGWLAVAIVLAALLLRLPSLGWGLPNSLHPAYSYHPDEAFFVLWADDLHEGKTFRKLFMYGGTAFFSTLKVSNLVAAWLQGTADPDMGARILAGRVLSLLATLATLLAVRAAAARLYGWRTGLVAMACLALYLGPLAVGQWARPDALFAALFAAHLLLVAHAWRARAVSGPRLWAPAIVLGIASAVRFPAASWAAAWLPMLPRRPLGVTLRTLALLTLASLVAFAFVSPHSWLHWSAFLDGLDAQFAQQRGQYVEGMGRGPSAWQYGTRIWAAGTSAALYPFALAGVLFASWRRRPADRVLLLAAAPYALLLSVSHWVTVHYFLPLLAIGAIAGARMVVLGLRARRRALRVAWAGAFGAALLGALAVDIAYVRAVVPVDPRDEALLALVEQYPAGTHIGTFQFYPGDVYWQPPAETRYTWHRCAMGHCDVDGFLAAPFDLWVLESTFLAPVADGIDTPPLPDYRALREAFTDVHRFTRVTQFGRLPEIFGFELPAWLSDGILRTPMPVIEIYARAK